MPVEHYVLRPAKSIKRPVVVPSESSTGSNSDEKHRWRSWRAALNKLGPFGGEKLLYGWYSRVGVCGRLQQTPPGFDPDMVLAQEIAKLSGPEEIREFLRNDAHEILHAAYSLFLRTAKPAVVSLLKADVALCKKLKEDCHSDKLCLWTKMETAPQPDEGWSDIVAGDCPSAQAIVLPWGEDRFTNWIDCCLSIISCGLLRKLRTDRALTGWKWCAGAGKLLDIIYEPDSSKSETMRKELVQYLTVQLRLATSHEFRPLDAARRLFAGGNLDCIAEDSSGTLYSFPLTLRMPSLFLHFGGGLERAIDYAIWALYGFRWPLAVVQAADLLIVDFASEVVTGVPISWLSDNLPDLLGTHVFGVEYSPVAAVCEGNGVFFTVVDSTVVNGCNPEGQQVTRLAGSKHLQTSLAAVADEHTSEWTPRVVQVFFIRTGSLECPVLSKIDFEILKEAVETIQNLVLDVDLSEITVLPDDIVRSLKSLLGLRRNQPLPECLQNLINSGFEKSQPKEEWFAELHSTLGPTDYRTALRTLRMYLPVIVAAGFIWELENRNSA
jgi:hypothetical protein